MSDKASPFRSKMATLTACFLFIAYIGVVSTILCLLQYQYNTQLSDQVIVRPDFNAIQHIPDKKKQFFQYIGVLADVENTRIGKQRNQLFHIYDVLNRGGKLSRREVRQLLALSEEYKVLDIQGDLLRIKALMSRVNMVPRALIQAQAAIESGWGTSRFAIEGNNLFGQWCFSKGCGIVPSGRLAGKTHEVATFSSDQYSVSAYVLNLNTFHVYEKLRALRATLSEDDIALAGGLLAGTLDKYSERGQAYVSEVQHMIRKNGLE